MGQVGDQGNLIERFIKDHLKEVSEYSKFLEDTLDLLYEEEIWTRTEPIQSFVKRVIDHFEFEEKTIFPIVLSSYAMPESIKLVLELQREHGIMLRQLEELQEIMGLRNTPPGDIVNLNKEIHTKLVNVVMREIIDNILSHASKEDNELWPILAREMKDQSKE